MSAEGIELRDYAEALRMCVEHAPMHPSSRCAIFHWMGALEIAADDGDAAGVAALAKMIEDRVKQEMAWQAEDRAIRPGDPA